MKFIENRSLLHSGLTFFHDAEIGCKSEGSLIRVEFGEQIDLRLIPVIRSICNLVRTKDYQSIVLDLSGTETILDCGLAMLLILVKCAQENGANIDIYNANRRIENQIRHAARHLHSYPHPQNPSVALRVRGALRRPANRLDETIHSLPLPSLH